MFGDDSGARSDHWLYRFTADEWLRAATGELHRAEDALLRKQQRAGVAQARRAAGMAWNAVLVHTRDETGYGRSYMDHLNALTTDESAPDAVRQAARALVTAPLVRAYWPLGRGETTLARAAEAILAHARERVAPHATS